jgi:glycerol kinase
MPKLLMAMDQGTTSSRCVLFDKRLNIVSSAQLEFSQIFPKEGWVEHDALEILQTQMESARQAMAKAGVTGKDIAAIGIANQRETVVVWDKRTGKPISNAIVWQCRRTAEACDELKKAGFAPIAKAKTGLVVDAYFSATKLAWMLENVEGARKLAEEGNALFGTIDSWLIWNMTKGQVHATDYTNASRTMLFNIRELKWDQEILDWLKIPAQMLPEAKPSSHVFGMADLFGTEVPIAGAAGDQQAALFGQCCFSPGEVKNTYGTGCFILMNTGEKAIEPEGGMLTTIAWGLDGKVEYAVEGSVFVAGAAIQWLRDGLSIISQASETDELAQSVENTAGVYMVPAFVGLGAPYWDQYARGIISGITRGANRAHVVRAALESIAYQSYDVIKAMETASGLAAKAIKVDGGASRNNFLMQFQADILGMEVIRADIAESTALGAACLAGLAAGVYSSQDEILENRRMAEVFKPKMELEDAERLLAGWKKAVARCLEG